MLPTYEGIVKCYAYHRRAIIQTSLVKEPSFGEISKMIREEDLVSLYNKLNIRIVTKQRVTQLLKKQHLKYISIKSKLRKSQSSTIKAQLEEFKNKSKITLFDIAACKCSSHKVCRCHCSEKLSLRFQKFLYDQRSSRTMRFNQIMLNSTRNSYDQEMNNDGDDNEIEYEENSDEGNEIEVMKEMRQNSSSVGL